MTSHARSGSSQSSWHLKLALIALLTGTGVREGAERLPGVLQGREADAGVPG